MKLKIAFFLASLFVSAAYAQPREIVKKDSVAIDEDDLVEVIVNNKVYWAVVTEKDTIILDDLEGGSITMPRSFKNDEERRLYYKYKRAAQKVLPYALKAIEVHRKIEENTKNMSKRKRRRYIKKLQKEMDDEFEEPLKKLTKTQGKVLIKMIERELDTPFHSLVKSMRGGFTAFYWNGLGRINGYRLKEGYDPNDDPILEMVLSDFNLD